MNRLSRHLLLGLAGLKPRIKGRAQAGAGLRRLAPREERLHAGQTEVLVDGAVRITEWPEDSEDSSLALVTYHLGTNVVKVTVERGARGLVVRDRRPDYGIPNGRGWTPPAACAISSFRARGGDALWRRVHLPRSEQRLHRS